MAAKPRSSVSASLGVAVLAVSMLAGVIILVAVLFSVGRDDIDPVPPAVDYASVVEQLRREFPYDVASPDAPDGWRATSVDHAADARGHWWRVGFVIDGHDFVGLQQSDGEVNSLIERELADYEPDGTSVIDGATWDRMRRAGQATDYALVSVTGGVATIVYGSEPYDELERFASSLS